MKIYTRFGDEGFTQLLGGLQVRKNDTRVALCGTLDELNAVLGMVACRTLPEELETKISRIQSDLFNFGAIIASVGVETKMDLPGVSDDDSVRLETEIDQMEETLKPLTNFLLPGGAVAASSMHLARAVCRRAERLLVDLAEETPDMDASKLYKFLNRLSDWCFVAARFINHHEGVEEPLWKSS